MRRKIALDPPFPLQLDGSTLKIYGAFMKRYERIDDILRTHPAILDAVHEDLGTWGSCAGRESTYTSEMVLRMLVVKCIEGETFRSTVVRVCDSPVLRNFTRINSGPVMNFTMLNSAWKKIRPETWGRINAMLRDGAIEAGVVTGERLRIDSTVCESNIHYPTDSSLLWDVYRTGSRLIRECIGLEPSLSIGNRFHDAKIKQLHTFVATHSSKMSKATKRKVRRNLGVLIERTAHHLEVCREFVATAKRGARSLLAARPIEELERMIAPFEKVVSQARRAHSGETVPACERVFSIFEPHTELLMRGKAYKPVEFGHMVSIGQSRQKFITYYGVEEQSRHDIKIGDEAIEHHKSVFGAYPEEFTADKNYYGGPEHLEKWEQQIAVYSVGKKGKRTQEQIEREHGLLFRLLQKFRAGCEGSISVLKRVYGLRRCVNQGFSSFASSIGSMVFCHNLVLLARL